GEAAQDHRLASGFTLLGFGLGGRRRKLFHLGVKLRRFPNRNLKGGRTKLPDRRFALRAQDQSRELSIENGSSKQPAGLSELRRGRGRRQQGHLEFGVRCKARKRRFAEL